MAESKNRGGTPLLPAGADTDATTPRQARLNFGACAKMHPGAGGWSNAEQQEGCNFRAALDVKEDEMRSTSIPDAAVGPGRVQHIRCVALEAPAWEYKIGIASAGVSAGQKEVPELFLNVLAKRGWIFVGENQGIFHFKRPKR